MLLCSAKKTLVSGSVVDVTLTCTMHLKTIADQTHLHIATVPPDGSCLIQLIHDAPPLEENATKTPQILI